MVIQNTSLDGKLANITFTIKEEDLNKTLGIIEKNKQKINYNKLTHDAKLAKVSIIGAGMIASPGVTHKMFRTLSNEKINILAISTSEIKISVLVEESLTQKAVKALHKTFGLDQ
jgi:aspartate kinase